MARCSGWPHWWYRKIHQAFSLNLKITLALAGVMVACLSVGQVDAIIPLLLGVIACALAETDDNWRGRLWAVLITLLCFVLIIRSVQLSLSHPAYLLAVFAASAFVLTLLGALGERYRAMASATLIMALYAALATQPNASRVLAQDPEVLLLSGAAWFGLISVLWAAWFPMLPVEQNLARLYDTLGPYLTLKARMFEPIRGIDLEQRRLELALHNGRVVDALNVCKESLFSRMTAKQAPAWLSAALHQFFVAQDVHERASSSHEHYDLLANTFFHSDVLYRCQRVLARLGQDCRVLADAIRWREPWARGDETARAIEDMAAAVIYVASTEEGRSAEYERPQRSLQALATNLSAMNQEVSGVLQNEKWRMPADTALQDSQPRTLRQFKERLFEQMTLRSPLMRHAIRLSLALAVGYALMQVSGDTYGFWILLTIVLVCQPQYGATLTRLMERIGGTLLGLAIGWALLKLFPASLAQAAFTVVAAVVFFSFRSTRYTLATAAITSFVLLSFNPVGDGFGLIIPRLCDTLAGSFIAGIAVWLVLPSWYSRRLHPLAADALRAQSRYFDGIMGQYGVAGKQDDLIYRIARRDAHNADAAFSNALTAAFKEPGYVQQKVESGTRFLVLSHTLLSYLSALGAHRTARVEPPGEVIAAAMCLKTALEEMSIMVESRQPTPDRDRQAEAVVLQALADSDGGGEQSLRVLRAQLSLALRLLPSLRQVARELV